MLVKKTQVYSWAVISILWLFSASLFADDACDHLSTAKIPNTTISLAQQIAAGEIKGPPPPFIGGDLTRVYKSLPAFCRVVAEAKPTSDSNIKMEIWLPAAGWNGKLLGLGNGGFAG